MNHDKKITHIGSYDIDICGDIRHLITASPSGELFYSGKIGETWGNTSCICKHYYVKEDNMRNFLK